MAVSSKNNLFVFVSYAEDDTQHADRFYTDLKNAGLIPWKATSVLPGANRENAISSAINSCRFFIPLFSSISIEQGGHWQKELKDAIEVSENLPPNKVYIIPVRLDDCQVHEDL